MLRDSLLVDTVGPFVPGGTVGSMATAREEESRLAPTPGGGVTESASNGIPLDASDALSAPEFATLVRVVMISCWA